MTFETGITLISRTAFCLDSHICLPFGSNVFEGGPVTVFPVVAVVENTFEPNLVEVIEFPVDRQRVALTLAGDIILPYLIVIDIDIAVVIFLPNKFRVVRPGGSMIIGGCKHHSETVVEKTVSESKTEIHLRLAAYPVVASSRNCSDSESVR